MVIDRGGDDHAGDYNEYHYDVDDNNNGDDGGGGDL